MSAKKHLDTLAELYAHPIAHNIAWSDLIAALSSIGDLRTEKNGNYEFIRNGHRFTFARTNNKDVDSEEIITLRHFLRTSSFPNSGETHTPSELIIAIAYHDAFICRNPGTEGETRKRLHADLTQGRVLRKHRTSPPFNDTNPLQNESYYKSVMDEMLNSTHIVILSHGTGTSNAAMALWSHYIRPTPSLSVE